MSKLQPTVVSETTAFDAAIEQGRSRPIVATKKDGTMVLCCQSTARKHGWTFEGRMYPRIPRKVYQAAVPAKKASSKKSIASMLV